MDVLVLNADFNCINSVSWKRAFNLVLTGKVEVVQYSDKVISNYNNSTQYKVPKIIRLLRFISTIYNAKVPFHKKNVMIRDKHTCQYCGVKASRTNKMTIDHIIPQCRGGANDWYNCVTACEECNVTKADKLLENTNMKLRTVPREPNPVSFYKYKFDKFNLTEVKELFL